MDSPLFCAVVGPATGKAKKAYGVFGYVLHTAYVLDFQSSKHSVVSGGVFVGSIERFVGLLRRNFRRQS